MARVTLDTILSELKKRDVRDDDRFQFLKQEFQRLSGQVGGVEDRLDGVEGELGKVNGRLDGVEGELGKVNGRLDGVEGQLGRLEAKVDQRFDRVDGDLKIIRIHTANLTERVVQLERTSRVPRS